jgi:predicted permease
MTLLDPGRAFPMLDSIWQDLRFAVRSLSRRPLFLLVPVLSLAIGIGANTAIFSALKSLVLSDPPGIPNASRMVELGRGRDGQGFESFSYPDFLDLREEADPLAELAGMSMQMLTLSRGKAGERAFAMLVSANFFEVLGVRTAMGRTFLPEEDEGPDEHPVVVLNHRFWEERLGGDPDILGATVYVSRTPYTVVGVTHQEYVSPLAIGSPDIYVPLMQYPSLNEGQSFFEARSSSWFQVFGLLRPGATMEEADAAVVTIFSRLAEEYPESNARRTAAVRPYGALPAVIRGPTGLFLGVLMAFVGLILLVTCANVAGMFLARASSRRKEIAIRLSVGSGRGQLIRHLLTESLVIFALGGVGGVLLANWGLGLITAWDIPAPFPVRLDFSPDAGVLLFGGTLTLVTGLIFGLLPAHEALSLDLVGSLKGEGADPRSGEGRLRRAFVGAQIGASLVLLVAAGLFLRALQHAGQIETGFEARGAYISFVDLAQEGYQSEEGAVFQQEILDSFSDQPWVEEVALAADLPLDLSSSGTVVVPEGWEARSQEEDMGTDFNSVSPEYFSTLRIPLLEGRVFDPSDRESAELVTVVSRTFADRAWPGESALGRRVLWNTRNETWLTVVGVVEDTHNQVLTERPKPFLYRPLAQRYRAAGHLVIRSNAELATVTQSIREGLRAMDSRISVSPVIAMDRYTEVSLLPQRVAGILSSSLGLLALLLSGMGVYGVMASMVSRRRREIGIRVALGAEPGAVLKSVLGGAFRLALPGLALGIVLATGVGFLLRSLLLGVSPADPATLLGVAAAVSVMVLAGTMVPARKAVAVDPAEALRQE